MVGIGSLLLMQLADFATDLGFISEISAYVQQYDPEMTHHDHETTRINYSNIQFWLIFLVVIGIALYFITFLVYFVMKGIYSNSLDKEWDAYHQTRAWFVAFANFSSLVVDVCVVVIAITVIRTQTETAQKSSTALQWAWISLGCDVLSIMVKIAGSIKAIQSKNDDYNDHEFRQRAQEIEEERDHYRSESQRKDDIIELQESEIAEKDDVIANQREEIDGLRRRTIPPVSTSTSTS